MSNRKGGSKKERIPGSVKIWWEEEEDSYSLWNNLLEPRAHLWGSLLKGLSTRGLRVKGNEASILRAQRT